MEKCPVCNQVIRRAKLVAVKCQCCGKMFQRIPSVAKKAKYCSKECADKVFRRGDVAQQRRIRALELRSQGLTYYSIGKEIGCSASRARDIVYYHEWNSTHRSMINLGWCYLSCGETWNKEHWPEFPPHLSGYNKIANGVVHGVDSELFEKEVRSVIRNNVTSAWKEYLLDA